MIEEVPKGLIEDLPWNGVYYALTKSKISTSNIAERARNFRASDDVSGVWPSRLIDIDSMTSYPRDGNNCYNGIKEPQFTILSYKWGLSVQDGSSDLDIKGIDWSLPAIDPNYFTVAEMANVFRKLRKYAEFTWVDVGCVDQYLNEITMRDIIVEPRNFKIASQTFVWWVDFTTDVLTQLLNDIANFEVSLTQASINPKERDDLELIPALLSQVFDPLTTLLGIDWFSSNWTLRETMLCEDVIILNREGDVIPIREKSGQPANIDMIGKLCTAILAWLQRIEHRLSLSDGKHDVLTVGRNPISQLKENPESRANIPTLATLVEMCLELVQKKKAFFLYSSFPDVMNHWTKVLLETGVMVIEDDVGANHHVRDCSSERKDEHYEFQYGGWGGGFRLACECRTYITCGCEGGRQHHPNYCPGKGGAISRLGARDTCIPCLLDISYPLHGSEPITPHTDITARREKKTDLEARLGTKVQDKYLWYS